MDGVVVSDGRKKCIRKASSTVMQRFASAILIFLFMAILAFAVCAFNYPLELEYRESTSFLHVLTYLSGHSLYDHKYSALLNMNHGPLDPIVKTAIYKLLPFLSPWALTRIWVLLLPIIWLLASLVLLQKFSWRGITTSLTLFLPFYLASIGLHPFHLFVGRSDPLATTLLVIASSIGVWLSVAIQKSRWLDGLFGLILGLCFLTNWRFAPILMAIFFAAYIKIRPFKILYKPAGLALSIFLIPFLIIFGLEFKYSGGLYFQHFFGFFSGESGWGRAEAQSLEVVLWRMLVKLSVLIPFMLVLPFGAKPKLIIEHLKRRLMWYLAFGFSFGTTVIALYLNQAGGGDYYLSPVFVVLWGISHLIVNDFSKEITGKFGVLSGVRGLLIVLSILIIPPWGMLRRNFTHLIEYSEPAREFAQQLQEINQNSGVFSELHHFYRQYPIAVDMGDVAEAVRKTEFYGGDFNSQVDEFFKILKERPPLIYTSVIKSQAMREILDEYVVLRYSPPHFLFNQWADSQLMVRKDLESEFRVRYKIPSSRD